MAGLVTAWHFPGGSSTSPRPESMPRGTTCSALPELSHPCSTCTVIYLVSAFNIAHFLVYIVLFLQQTVYDFHEWKNQYRSP